VKVVVVVKALLLVVALVKILRLEEQEAMSLQLVKMLQPEEEEEEEEEEETVLRPIKEEEMQIMGTEMMQVRFEDDWLSLMLAEAKDVVHQLANPSWR